MKFQILQKTSWPNVRVSSVPWTISSYRTRERSASSPSGSSSWEWARSEINNNERKHHTRIWLDVISYIVPSIMVLKELRKSFTRRPSNLEGRMSNTDWKFHSLCQSIMATTGLRTHWFQHVVICRNRSHGGQAKCGWNLMGFWVDTGKRTFDVANLPVHQVMNTFNHRESITVRRGTHVLTACLILWNLLVEPNDFLDQRLGPYWSPDIPSCMLAVVHYSIWW